MEENMTLVSLNNSIEKYGMLKEMKTKRKKNDFSTQMCVAVFELGPFGDLEESYIDEPTDRDMTNARKMLADYEAEKIILDSQIIRKFNKESGVLESSLLMGAPYMYMEHNAFTRVSEFLPVPEHVPMGHNVLMQVELVFGYGDDMSERLGRNVVFNLTFGEGEAINFTRVLEIALSKSHLQHLFSYIQDVLRVDFYDSWGKGYTITMSSDELKDCLMSLRYLSVELIKNSEASEKE